MAKAPVLHTGERRFESVHSYLKCKNTVPKNGFMQFFCRKRDLDAIKLQLRNVEIEENKVCYQVSKEIMVKLYSLIAQW